MNLELASAASGAIDRKDGELIRVQGCKRTSHHIHVQPLPLCKASQRKGKKRLLPAEAFVHLANDYHPKGVQLVGISSNSTQTHPQDGPEQMAEDAKQHGYPFPYLYDESQTVAKQYQAACTPEFFLFDASLNLQYHGQFDSSRPSNDVSITGDDIRRALDSLLQGEEPAVKVKPSIGCNIKWHPGKKPAYAQQ